MDIICNRCGDDDAFFNGVSYKCPNFDNEWGHIHEDNNRNNFENDDDDEYIKERFEHLSAIEKLFFK